MKKPDIIVIGASIGGVTALRTLFQSFPADFPAAIFVVQHVSPLQPSFLPAILQGQTGLHVAHAEDDEPIRAGRAYVAPPNHHLVIEPGHMHLTLGPRENRSRPSINTLFRSAALAYGPQVIGVILTGSLDDGTAGLWEIKRRGGVAVVQSPEDAECRQMPAEAINNVHVDYQVPIREMGALLSMLVGRVRDFSESGEVAVVMPQATRLTCPDCHGPIERFQSGPVTEYKCRVGHAYSPGNMLAAHEDAEERALWSAIESLEEGADLADEIDGNSVALEGGSLRGNAEGKRSLARVIREAVENRRVEAEAD
jgi:two-component system, chemotaxis family, protein-glutamate methylesterase/glutaminase